MQVRGRVLSVASECVPLVKTGGLADVVAALPPANAGSTSAMGDMMRQGGAGELSADALDKAMEQME